MQGFRRHEGLGGPVSKRVRYGVIAAALVVVAVAGVAAVAGPRSMYDVQAEGRHIVPGEEGGGKVYRVQVLDTATIYADSESRPNSSVFSGSALVALATASLMALLLLSWARANRRVLTFLKVTAAGAAFLAADDLLGIHETIGHTLYGLNRLPGVDRGDDVVKALYMIPALAYVVYFRDLLLVSERCRRLFAAGLVLFGVTVVADLAGSGAETPAKLLGVSCLLAGFILVLAHHLREGLALLGAELTLPTTSAGRRFARSAPGAPSAPARRVP
jgi:hypothetical protein